MFACLLQKLAIGFISFKSKVLLYLWNCIDPLSSQIYLLGSGFSALYVAHSNLGAEILPFC
jgi:hypothetical protein